MAECSLNRLQTPPGRPAPRPRRHEISNSQVVVVVASLGQPGPATPARSNLATPAESDSESDRRGGPGRSGGTRTCSGVAAPWPLLLICMNIQNSKSRKQSPCSPASHWRETATHLAEPPWGRSESCHCKLEQARRPSRALQKGPPPPRPPARAGRHTHTPIHSFIRRAQGP
jgi:hypothetical protein